MTNRSLEIVTGLPTPPSSATDPPPPSRWWTQLHSLFLRRKELTEEESSAIFFKPYFCGFLTIVAVTGIFLFVDSLFCHVSFSVESISVSPSSSAELHFHFLARNPSSWCPINYDGDDVYAKLGSVNAAVLKTSRKRGSRGGHESFSVDLATPTEGYNRVFELDMKLSAKKKHPRIGDEYGHFNIRCRNLTIGYQKTKCHSSFKELDKSIYRLFY